MSCTPQWKIDESYPRKLAYGNAFLNSHCVVNLPYKLVTLTVVEWHRLWVENLANEVVCLL